MKILVTGGSGCVGRRLIEVLLEHNHYVIAPLREGISLIGAGDQGRFHPISWSSPPPALPFSEIDVIVHSAALHPATGHEFSSNVMLTELALGFSKTFKAKQIILISSVAVYGDLHEGAREDDATIQPDGPYGVSKSESEKLVVDFCRRENRRYTIFRPGMIYGSYDRGLILRLIRIIGAGLCIRFGDGRNKRSLVSNETIAGVVLASLLNEKFYDNAFILVGKQPRSINQIIDGISGLLGKRPFILTIPKWVLSGAGIFLSFINKLGIKTRVTSFDLKKLVCNASYNPRKLEAILGPIVEEDFVQLLKKEIDWYLRARTEKTNALPASHRNKKKGESGSNLATRGPR